MVIRYIESKPGIYLTWPECQEQVLGYPKAQFAAFETIEKAMEYYRKQWSIIIYFSKFCFLTVLL